MATRWGDLSERSRRLIIAAAIGEAVLKTAVLIDIRRRPASQIRGSKRMWIIAAVLVNSAGVGPLSYFAFGRRARRRRQAGSPGRGLSDQLSDNPGSRACTPVDVDRAVVTSQPRNAAAWRGVALASGRRGRCQPGEPRALAALRCGSGG